jgi:hypothetical protein
VDGTAFCRCVGLRGRLSLLMAPLEDSDGNEKCGDAGNFAYLNLAWRSVG